MISRLNMVQSIFANTPMRFFAFWMSVATILTLNVVIVLGLLDPSDTPLFVLMIGVLHVVLPISSVLMLTLLVNDRHRTGAAIFAAIVAGMLVVATMQITGPEFSRNLHLVTDLLALNGYLIVVPWYRSRLARRG